MIGNPLFQLINPFLYFQVISTLLTMPIFWILSAMIIVGLFVGQKEEEGYHHREGEERKAREEAKRRGGEEQKKVAEQSNSIGMKFTLIPAGEFMMGSEECDGEKPVYKVNMRKPFYLSIYPVTQREWKAVMGNKPLHFKGDDLPVEQVTWDDVQAFIWKLNEKEGTNKYRLPSDAEWEYACRAGTTTKYSFGDDESKLGDYAWYCDNSSGKTHPVGTKKPNPYGLYDMHGNVWEWVQDCWHDDYGGAPTDGGVWEGGDSSTRVIRGGGWNNTAEVLRSAHRSLDDLNSRGNIGFRIVGVRMGL
jgi:formylglycine-generating enzyme required for sulfatase activity